MVDHWNPKSFQRSVHSGNRIRRFHMRRGLSKKLIFGAIGALAVASFSVLGWLLYLDSSPDTTQQLDIGLRLLRKGDGESSARIARSLPATAIKKRSDISKKEFLLGAHARRKAEAIQQRRVSIEHNEEAVKRLSKSRDLSFPEGHEGQGNYLLGLALFDLLRWEEAEPALEIASERWPQGRVDAIERLVDIDLSESNQAPDVAFERVRQWRALPKSTLNEDDRANLKEMQILYSMKEYDKVIAFDDLIAPDSPLRAQCELIVGRCLHKLAMESAEPEQKMKLQKAISYFQRVLNYPNIPVHIRRQSNLELGRVVRDLGEKTNAVSTFSILRLSSPYEAESLVSGLEEIDCLIDLGRFADAVATLDHITKSFGEQRWYENDWMPIGSMRNKVVASGQRMIDQKAYAEAARFANLLPPFCEEQSRLQIISRLYDLWAKQLRSQGETDGKTEAYHRIAAIAFSKLATKMLRAPDYSNLLLKAIENYRLAGDFEESNRHLDIYLQFEPRENIPFGLLTKAKNYNSLDQVDKALSTLQKLLDTNTSTSLIHDARLEAAKLYATQDDFTAAEELIVQNLYYSDLKPESSVWRESLFELGELLFRKGEKLQSQALRAIQESPSKSVENLGVVEQSYNELVRGIARIEEGLRRFESDPRRSRMMYTTAKAYQMAATWPELLLRENRLANEDTITNWENQNKELLAKSRAMFRKLRQEIVSQPSEGANSETSRISENFLRNSFFGEADLLFEAGEYDEAMVSYRDAANRFINEPESIEAMIQIANCQKQLGKPADSRRTLEMTKDILNRISPEKDAKFKEVTSHDREGWQRYINWMNEELEGN